MGHTMPAVIQVRCLCGEMAHADAVGGLYRIVWHGRTTDPRVPCGCVGEYAASYQVREALTAHADRAPAKRAPAARVREAA